MVAALANSQAPRFLVFLLSVSALTGAVLGCGETRVLSAQEAKDLLRQLPYRYDFREVPTPEGAEAAVAGRAIGRHHTELNFGIALGHGSEPVMQRPSAVEIDRHSSFIFTSDAPVRGSDGRLEPARQLKTAAQWREATQMDVLMTDKLCRATTGKHCPAV